MTAARIHIQHVLLSLQPGGLENGVVNVVNGLDPARYRSSLCCLKHAGEFTARIHADGVAIDEMGWRGGNDAAMPFRLARLFRRTRPDIVHTRNAESFYYGFLGAKLAGVPAIVHSEHGRIFDDRPLRFRVQRLFSRHTDRIFAVTEQLKRDLVHHVRIPASRIEVLYNGVDPGRFRPAAREAQRATLGLAPGDLAIGSVGRLAAVKNYPLLIRALRRLDRADARLLLVGEGPERNALQTLVRELGLEKQVRFLGHRDDVADCLAAFDIFVLPSVSEGMSNTLLEAMGAGVAVVASDVGGNPEIVRAGVDGLLFPSGDLDALTIGLRTLAAQPATRARLAAAGRGRVLRDFSIDAMIFRYQTLYESACRAVAPAQQHS